MRKLHDFNQQMILENLMQQEGLEQALGRGSCLAFSLAFIKLALQGKSILEIGQIFQDNYAEIASLQQRYINLHYYGMDGYSHALNALNLTWDSLEYSNAFSLFKPGKTCLCGLDGHLSGHAIAFVYQLSDLSIYMFDPDTGIYKCDQAPLNMFEFSTYRIRNNCDHFHTIAFRDVRLA